jgi:hypothetical protein
MIITCFQNLSTGESKLSLFFPDVNDASYFKSPAVPQNDKRRVEQ